MRYLLECNPEIKTSKGELYVNYDFLPSVNNNLNQDAYTELCTQQRKQNFYNFFQN